MAMVDLRGRDCRPEPRGDGSSEYSVTGTKTELSTLIWRGGGARYELELQRLDTLEQSSALEITRARGRLLIAAKRDLLHGSFGAWLASIGLTKQRAAEAMQVAAYLDNWPLEKSGMPDFRSVRQVLAAIAAERGDKPKPRPVVIDLQPDPNPEQPFDLANQPKEVLALIALAKAHESHSQVAAKLFEAARLLRDALAVQQGDADAQKPAGAAQYTDLPRKRREPLDSEQRALQLAQLPA
ncbi:hypothetical protein, partial [Geminicoccus flavidas]|uniref:hypothetical protein n=1 Tax=Geminicoccus flavidas TaxID=2506407 RepID=UPI00135896C6